MALEFTHLDGHAVHRQRAREILARHPEVRKLLGQNPMSAVWVVSLVTVQWLAAYLLHDVSWLWIFVAAYLFGAFVNHALYVLIHECTHNLVFRNKTHNNYLGILCDFALAFPSAMAFRKYHLLHHQHLGEYEMDPDIVCHTEGQLVRDSAWRKALWVALLGVSQALRPLKVKGVKALDAWIITNILIIALVDLFIWFVIGPKALAYLALSTFFALGLHPVGGRWIQEHYETKKGQETYSYYGPLNRTCFNMGYHNEHHDFAGVPWNNLPKLRQLAPDYYDSLASYRSWTAVLLKFIFDPSMTTYSRVVRAGQNRAQRRAERAPARATTAENRAKGRLPDDAASLDAPVGVRPDPAPTRSLALGGGATAVAALFLSSAIRKRIDRLAVLQRARWRAEAGLLHLFWRACAALEPGAASAFGRRFLRIIGPHAGKGAHIDRNLMLAFPELGDDERAALQREVWGNAGAVLGEYPHFKAICHDDFEGHFEFVEKWNLDDYRAGKRHGVFVSAHLGNWEFCAAAAGRQGIPITVIYAPSRNPFIDRMLRRRREALGCRLVSLEEGARPLIRELSEGRSVGLVVDTRDDDGVPIPFFGLDKLTTLAPARLALRFGCDLIPTRVERLGDARFRLTVYEPVRPDVTLASDKDQAIQMMGDVNRLFEQWIRERPEQWLCIKRAWPRDIDPTSLGKAPATAQIGAASRSRVRHPRTASS